jgi:hypothetical protein
MVVALARKILIALWRMRTTGEIPQGVVLRPADEPSRMREDKLWFRRPPLELLSGAPISIRGGGDPSNPMAFNAVPQNGSAVSEHRRAEANVASWWDLAKPKA